MSDQVNNLTKSLIFFNFTQKTLLIFLPNSAKDLVCECVKKVFGGNTQSNVIKNSESFQSWCKVWLTQRPINP